MKIAFRADACAEISLHRAIELAAQFGFDGIEIPASYASTVDVGTPVLSLAAGDDVNQLPGHIELAAKLNGPFVRISSGKCFDSSGVVLPKIAESLLHAGHTAAANGVVILVDNESTFGAMHRLWRLLDRLNQPSIGCNWNSLFARKANDDPTVAVPTLNSFIRSVQLQDANIVSGAILPCNLGTGDLPIRKMMDRLRGIGFDGLLTLNLAEQANKTATEFEQSLAHALVVLQQWQIAKTPVS